MSAFYVPSLRVLCATSSAKFISDVPESGLKSLPDEVLKDVLIHLSPLGLLSLEEKYPKLTDFEGNSIFILSYFEDLWHNLCQTIPVIVSTSTPAKQNFFNMLFNITIRGGRITDDGRDISINSYPIVMYKDDSNVLPATISELIKRIHPYVTHLNVGGLSTNFHVKIVSLVFLFV
jgi:hypothetical protein